MQVLTPNPSAYQPQGFNLPQTMTQYPKKPKLKTMVMKKSSKSCSICLEGFC